MAITFRGFITFLNNGGRGIRGDQIEPAPSIDADATVSQPGAGSDLDNWLEWLGTAPANIAKKIVTARGIVTSARQLGFGASNSANVLYVFKAGSVYGSATGAELHAATSAAPVQIGAINLYTASGVVTATSDSGTVVTEVWVVSDHSALAETLKSRLLAAGSDPDDLARLLDHFMHGYHGGAANPDYQVGVSEVRRTAATIGRVAFGQYQRFSTAGSGSLYVYLRVPTAKRLASDEQTASFIVWNRDNHTVPWSQPIRAAAADPDPRDWQTSDTVLSRSFQATINGVQYDIWERVQGLSTNTHYGVEFGRFHDIATLENIEAFTGGAKLPTLAEATRGRVLAQAEDGETWALKELAAAMAANPALVQRTYTFTSEAGENDPFNVPGLVLPDSDNVAYVFQSGTWWHAVTAKDLRTRRYSGTPADATQIELGNTFWIYSNAAGNVVVRPIPLYNQQGDLVLSMWTIRDVRAFEAIPTIRNIHDAVGSLEDGVQTIDIGDVGEVSDTQYIADGRSSWVGGTFAADSDLVEALGNGQYRSKVDNLTVSLEIAQIHSSSGNINIDFEILASTGKNQGVRLLTDDGVFLERTATSIADKTTIQADHPLRKGEYFAIESSHTSGTFTANNAFRGVKLVLDPHVALRQEIANLRITQNEVVSDLETLSLHSPAEHLWAIVSHTGPGRFTVYRYDDFRKAAAAKAQTPEANISGVTFQLNYIGGMLWDSEAGILYVVNDGDPDQTKLYLRQVDPNTGVQTRVGTAVNFGITAQSHPNLSPTYTPRDMAIRPNGVAYLAGLSVAAGNNTYNSIYTLNLETGALGSKVYEARYGSREAFRGLAVSTTKMWVCSGDDLWEVNEAAGTLTLLTTGSQPTDTTGIQLESLSYSRFWNVLVASCADNRVRRWNAATNRFELFTSGVAPTGSLSGILNIAFGGPDNLAGRITQTQHELEDRLAEIGRTEYLSLGAVASASTDVEATPTANSIRVEHGEGAASILSDISGNDFTVAKGVYVVRLAARYTSGRSNSLLGAVIRRASNNSVLVPIGPFFAGDPDTHPLGGSTTLVLSAATAINIQLFRTNDHDVSVAAGATLHFTKIAE